VACCVAQAGAADVVDWLLERGVEIESPDRAGGDSPLHKAARNKHYGIYRTLVAKVHTCYSTRGCPCMRVLPLTTPHAVQGADETKKNKVSETARQLFYDSNA
jgi:hypothetical protein